MSESTGIEWTDATWNPWHGCHKVSPGCKFCYMFREKKQYGQNPDVVVRSKTTFNAPLKWPEARRVFTCSWSDFFIEEADPWRDEAWDIIRRTPQHTYQILTKRIERAEGRIPIPALPNVWLGMSIENQETADLRIPALLRTAAAVRFVSYEPALGPVDFWRYLYPKELGGFSEWAWLDWVIVGGESGPGARPFDLAWARNTIEQCKAAGVPCFVKQLGARPFRSVIGGAPRTDWDYHNNLRRWKDDREAGADGGKRPKRSDYPNEGCKEFLKLKDRKGGDMTEWPEWAQLREFPSASRINESRVQR